MKQQVAPTERRAIDAEAFLSAVLIKTREYGAPDEFVLRLATPEGNTLLCKIAYLIAQRSAYPKVVWFDVELDNKTPIDEKEASFDRKIDPNITEGHFPNPRAGTGKEKTRAALVCFGEFIKEYHEVLCRLTAMKFRPGNASELADISKHHSSSNKLAACFPAAAVDVVWMNKAVQLIGGGLSRELRLVGNTRWSEKTWFLAFPAE